MWQYLNFKLRIGPEKPVKQLHILNTRPQARQSLTFFFYFQFQSAAATTVKAIYKRHNYKMLSGQFWCSPFFKVSPGRSNLCHCAPPAQQINTLLQAQVGRLHIRLIHSQREATLTSKSPSFGGRKEKKNTTERKKTLQHVHQLLYHFQLLNRLWIFGPFHY